MSSGRSAAAKPPSRPSDPEIPVGSPGVPGGLLRRLGALAIDWLASLLIAVLLFPQFPYGSAESTAMTLIVFALEVIVFTWLIAGSFGQRILGLVVVRFDPAGANGSRLSLWRIALRTVLLCLVIPAVVYDQFGRGLHDRAAGSICIRTARRR